MKIDLQQRYEFSDDFFSLDGSVVMKLSADAAAEVCERASQHGLVIARIEGGIWHFPGFEARLDCIWDGVELPVDARAAEKNNLAAAEFICSEKQVHDVFIVTTFQMVI
ncbi:MAG: colicin immunity protein [Pseudomonas sp.]